MESKISEGKGENDIIQELVIFTNTAEYKSKMDKFMRLNCADFHDYHSRMRSGEGNKMEWMDVFQNYQELVEDELQKFCDQNDSNITEIFEKIRDHLASSQDTDFLPLFMKTMDEQHLFDQLCFCASEASREREAMAAEAIASEEKGAIALSGIYALASERVDPQEVDSWMVALSIPWAFKKLFKSAHKRAMRCVCVHTPGGHCELTVSIPYFGSWSLSFDVNGEWASCKDRVGRPVRVSGREDDLGDLTVKLIDASGTLMMIFVTMVSGNDMRLYRELYLCGEERGSPDATLTLHFMK
jgi:hypothetical protein